MTKIFENISSEYQILRGLLKAIENDCGCRLCLALGCDDHLDEGIFVLGENIAELIKKYNITDVEILPSGELEEFENNKPYTLERVRFRLFGIKYEGYRRKDGGNYGED